MARPEADGSAPGVDRGAEPSLLWNTNIKH